MRRHAVTTLSSAELAMRLTLSATCLILPAAVSAFVLQSPHVKVSQRRRANTVPAAIAVPVAQLEENLTTAERSVTSVVRNCSPSVAFVTSVLQNKSGRSSSRQTNPKLPPGRSLGAGSGFVVDSEGYIVTNYHVIARAYMLQRMTQEYEDTIDNLVNNATQLLGSSTTSLKQFFPSPTTFAQVYVRMGDAAQEYIKCRIVNVQPELDVAVLKLENNATSLDALQSVSFGSSSNLLVGQSLVAIGNPFGLDTSVTSGVVSALNREITVSTSNRIRNCIQTDASINPGNSGGPLLNLEGRVIGVNTAIVTTSGSSAGVGFAIPSDEVEPVVRDFIREDRLKQSKLAWLGVSIMKPSTSQRLQPCQNWVVSVEPSSPAATAGIQALKIRNNDGRVELGDCIVAVGGNDVTSFKALRQELEQRKRGEELAITLQNASGEKRVVYCKLGSIPSNQ